MKTNEQILDEMCFVDDNGKPIQDYILKGWKRVKDELPISRERVLIFSNEGVHSGYWDGYSTEHPSWHCDPIGSYAGDGCVYDVKYWMPLPNKPNEDK